MAGRRENATRTSQIQYARSTEPLGVLQMKRMKVRTMLLAAVFATLCVSPSMGRSYEFFQTDRNVALFSNPSDTTYTGLRVVFTGNVIPLQAFGIGANIQRISNENGVLAFEGTIPPLATCEIDWPINGPRVEQAFWLSTDGREYEIDVRSPLARMFFVVPPGVDEICSGCTCTPYVPIDIVFNGSWSRDADTLPLVRYEWAWSDGITAEGTEVERRFLDPGWYIVTLTVWDEEGLSDSLSSKFYIFIYRCEEP